MWTQRSLTHSQWQIKSITKPDSSEEHTPPWGPGEFGLFLMIRFSQLHWNFWLKIHHLNKTVQNGENLWFSPSKRIQGSKKNPLEIENKFCLLNLQLKYIAVLLNFCGTIFLTLFKFKYPCPHLTLGLALRKRSAVYSYVSSYVVENSSETVSSHDYNFPKPGRMFTQW